MAAEGPYRGAADAFSAIYDAYFPFLWRSARRLGVSETSIEDVLQDVFVIVHRHLHDFEGRSTMRTWIYGILLRVVRDHRRTMRRKRLSASCRRDEEVLHSLPAPGISPHDAVVALDAIRVLHHLLDALDDERREVFVLAELDELSGQEIAKILGIPIGTVYSRLRVARRAFDAAIASRSEREKYGDAALDVGQAAAASAPFRPFPRVKSP